MTKREELEAKKAQKLEEVQVIEQELEELNDWFFAWVSESKEIARKEKLVELVRNKDDRYTTKRMVRWEYAVPLTAEEICSFSGGLVIPANRTNPSKDVQ